MKILGKRVFVDLGFEDILMIMKTMLPENLKKIQFHIGKGKCAEGSSSGEQKKSSQDCNEQGSSECAPLFPT